MMDSYVSKNVLCAVALWITAGVLVLVAASMVLVGYVPPRCVLLVNAGVIFTSAAAVACQMRVYAARVSSLIRLGADLGAGEPAGLKSVR